VLQEVVPEVLEASDVYDWQCADACLSAAHARCDDGSQTIRETCSNSSRHTSCSFAHLRLLHKLQSSHATNGTALEPTAFAFGLSPPSSRSTFSGSESRLVLGTIIDSVGQIVDSRESTSNGPRCCDGC